MGFAALELLGGPSLLESLSFDKLPRLVASHTFAEPLNAGTGGIRTIAPANRLQERGSYGSHGAPRSSIRPVVIAMIARP